MSQSPNLSLPFLESGQAQKHVTLNESLRRLDAVVQLSVLGVHAEPPGEPAEGERHIVGAEATGVFENHANEIAAWQDGAWTFIVPQPGWRAWNLDTSRLLVWTGSEWDEAGGGAGEGDVAGPDGGVSDGEVALFDGATGKAVRRGRGTVDYLGVGAAPDETSTDVSNRLVVRGNRALFHAIPEEESPGSGDIKLQISKEAEGNTASVFFATDFSGRAEFGLVESDEFKLKVSADGESFREVVVVDPATGAFKSGARVEPLGLGTIDGGTVTPDPAARGLFQYVNDGAHVLAPSANPGSYVLQVTNGGSAAPPDTSGWTKVIGDPFTGTGAHVFLCAAVIGPDAALLSVRNMSL